MLFRSKMLNFFFFAVGFASISIGLTHAESGHLWNTALIFGGIFVGHALTEVLNDPTE